MELTSSTETGVTDGSADAELVLVGAGVFFPHQLTAEALAALGDCHTIYTILADDGVASLPEELRRSCVSVKHHYDPGRERTKNYDAVVATILGSLSQGSSVAWLTPGHPLVFDSVSERLRLGAARKGFSTRVIPGISCIDTILCEVGYEPANGLVVHEANAVVVQDIRLDPRLAVILLQIGVFGTDYPRLSGDEPLPDLSPLRDHLLRFYPAELDVAFVRSRWSSRGRGTIAWTPLAGMLDVTKRLVDGTTLFIPRADYRGLGLTVARPSLATATRERDAI